MKEEAVCRNGKKGSVTLTWNGTDSDLIELVAALMAAGVIGTAEGRELKVVDVIRVFEEVFHLKINALYTKRGKVFDRCTDTTPFIDSLRRSYNRMLDARLAAWLHANSRQRTTCMCSVLRIGRRMAFFAVGYSHLKKQGYVNLE